MYHTCVLGKKCKLLEVGGKQGATGLGAALSLGILMPQMMLLLWYKAIISTVALAHPHARPAGEGGWSNQPSQAISCRNGHCTFLAPSISQWSAEWHGNDDVCRCA